MKEPTLVTGGKVVLGAQEGNADPVTFIPRLVGLWREGRFPYHLVERADPLQKINDAVADVRSGETIKAVLGI